jgi:hypothetical protein
VRRRAARDAVEVVDVLDLEVGDGDVVEAERQVVLGGRRAHVHMRLALEAEEVHERVGAAARAGREVLEWLQRCAGRAA